MGNGTTVAIFQLSRKTFKVNTLLNISSNISRMYKNTSFNSLLAKSLIPEDYLYTERALICFITVARSVLPISSPSSISSFYKPRSMLLLSLYRIPVPYAQKDPRFLFKRGEGAFPGNSGLSSQQ